MKLPLSLQQAIEKELSQFNTDALASAYDKLAEKYRIGVTTTPAINTETARIAYLAARLPATYGAVFQVLQAIKNLRPELTIKSVLDLGAGPGTAVWAAKELFPEIQTVTCIENDLGLINLGKRLGLTQVDWKQGNLETLTHFPPHDLVIFSYSIGELSENGQKRMVKIGWESASQILAIIEPGTPRGFERIRTFREELIQLGAHMAAPCPHTSACPMTGGNWCHFSARIERTSLHRRMKQAELGYEDEKYSYIAMSKQEGPITAGRILRHPLKRSGHVRLEVCTPEGLKNVVISRKNKEDYKAARDLDWGDTCQNFCTK